MEIWCKLQSLQQKDSKVPKVITEELKEKAIHLREDGMSYKNISLQLDISERWCKTNLKQVENKLKKKFQNLYDKSKTSSGVSKTEVAQELEIYDLPETKVSKSMNTAVRRIRSNSKENIVRPDWMMPENSMFMTNEVVRASMDLEDRCNEEAFLLYCTLKANTEPNKYHELPSVRKIKAAMLGLAMATVSTSKNSGSKLTSWLDSLYKTANELEQRNIGVSVVVQNSNKVQLENFRDLEEYVL
jgi:hypothetical protein